MKAKSGAKYTIANSKGRICEIDHYVSIFGIVETERLTAGVIDELAEDVFVSGQCHALALELHEYTGWELYGLFSEFKKEDDDTPSHVVVKTLEGEYVDIKGIGAECRWARRASLKPINKEDVLQYEHIDYLVPNRKVAAEFVQPVLDRVEKQRKTNKFDCVQY